MLPNGGRLDGLFDAVGRDGAAFDQALQDFGFMQAQTGIAPAGGNTGMLSLGGSPAQQQPQQQNVAQPLDLSSYYGAGGAGEGMFAADKAAVEAKQAAEAPVVDPAANPYAPEGSKKQWKNSKGEWMSRNAEGGNDVLIYADGTVNLDAYGQGIGGVSRQEYIAGQQNSKKENIHLANRKMGVYDRPDLNGSQYQGSYMPYRGQDSESIEKWYDYYSENPELRKLLSLDEQQEMVYLDHRVNGTSGKEYKADSYAMRKEFGAPRKAGIGGQGYEWDYELDKKRETDDPFADIGKWGGNVGGYIDKDRPGGSLFQEGVGGIMDVLQGAVDASIGWTGIKGVKADDVLSAVITGITLGGGGSVGSALTGIMQDGATKQALSTLINQSLKQGINEAGELQNPKSEEGGAITPEMEDILTELDNIFRDEDTDLPEWDWEPPTPDEEIPPLVEETEDDGGGGGGGNVGGGLEGAGAPAQGDQVIANTSEGTHVEAWRHQNPDGTWVAGNDYGDVWEVEEPTDEIPWWEMLGVLTGGIFGDGGLSAGPGDVQAPGSSGTGGDGDGPSDIGDGTQPDGSGDGNDVGDGPDDGPGDGPGDGSGTGGEGEGTQGTGTDNTNVTPIADSLNNFELNRAGMLGLPNVGLTRWPGWLVKEGMMK